MKWIEAIEKLDRRIMAKLDELPERIFGARRAQKHWCSIVILGQLEDGQSVALACGAWLGGWVKSKHLIFVPCRSIKRGAAVLACGRCQIRQVSVGGELEIDWTGTAEGAPCVTLGHPCQVGQTIDVDVSFIPEDGDT